jgi:hypothetical protein
MIALKATDIFYETGGGVSADLQIRMTLRAIRVASCRKPNRSSMIGVAGSAGGRERLGCVVQRAVMACQAFLVDHLFVVKTQCGDMAGGTLFGKDRMRCG